nr:hypothetical protein [Tanacetum cinerariifolium]
MNSLTEIKSQFKFLTETLQDFGTMPIFERIFSQDLDLLEQHLTKDILSQIDYNTTLTKLITKFENDFNSEYKERMKKYTRFNAQSFQDTMICNMDSIGKYMLKIILHQQQTLQFLKQKKLMQTQEDHSNPIQALNVDSLKVDLVVIQNTCSKKDDKDLKGTRIKHGFKRASMSFFGQDDDTFTCTMLLNADQLQKQVDKDEFQEDGSMTAFWMYRDTLLEHMGNVKKSVAERTRHQRQYDRRVNKRQMQTQESKTDTGKALDAELVVTESNMIESEVQDDINWSGNDTDADETDNRPIDDEEPMAEVKLTAESSDEELEAPIEDQPLPTDASPIALLPGYIDDSNPEEDDKDPVDYPANGEDNDDNESSDDDDDDDVVEKDEEDDEEEEEHLAPIDPSVVPIDDLVPSS